MITQINIPKTEVSFKAFLLDNRSHRVILWLVALAIVIQFTIFKYMYPYANYIHGDSFSYLKAAHLNLDINTYLIGYSKFLRLFNVFNRTDLALTAFQYLFIQCSGLFLLFTIFYFYKPGKTVQLVLLCFMILNPLFLHLANLISSDGFFLALSLAWFALLLWIIHQPSNKIIIWHALVLFIAFTVRYNAMIYPFIAMLAFGFSTLPLKKKLIGIAAGLLFCGLFIFFTMYKYKNLTGRWQYSPFSGWQFANNALYTYRYIDSTNRKPVPQKFQPLDNMVRKFFDKTRDVRKFPSEAAMASTFYMWTPGMPLVNYQDSLFKKVNAATTSDFKDWASMGPLYKDYGMYIIKQYPWQFMRYFIWPNANKYYAPPVEFLKHYNGKRDSVPVQAMNWFGYKSQKVTTRMDNSTVWVLDFYPFLSGIINMLTLFTLVFYVVLKGWSFRHVFNKWVLMAGSLWLLNALFTISASSAALRFQAFPIIITTMLSFLLVDWMVQLIKSMKREPHLYKNTLIDI